MHHSYLSVYGVNIVNLLAGQAPAVFMIFNIIRICDLRLIALSKIINVDRHSAVVCSYFFLSHGKV